MSDKKQNERDNIQVSIRIKPLLEESKSCIRLDSNLKNTIIIDGQNQQEQKYFYFDYVASSDASQEDIFEIVGRQQAVNCLEGYNGCVFVYGQTGSGKTFTMMGTPKQPGLLPSVVEFLFNCIYQEQTEFPEVEYLIKCSYLEIYNEHIIDLLNPQSGNLQLREDLKKGVYVEYLTEESCTNTNDAIEILQRGAINRHISSTNMNIESSRSHSVFTVQVESRRQSSQTQVINHRFSRFHFVDLAGSERQKQSQVQGDRLREGCNINRSLHILGNVINALVEDSTQNKYVHYRDSKLTFLLKDSLGGNSRTHLIANIQQNQQYYQETLSTLMFSKRVKQVRNKARVNEDDSGNLESLKNEIKRLKQELARSIVSNAQPTSGQWESPTKRESSSIMQSQQFLQSLELEGIMINDQRYIKLEEILKCYLEQSTESEAALYLELAKYLGDIDNLKEGFQVGSLLEQQLKLIIKLQNEQISRLKKQQNCDDINPQLQQSMQTIMQHYTCVMKTYKDNLSLKEQNGTTTIVSKTQSQIEQNVVLLKDIVQTVNTSLNERKQFQSQLESKFNQTYVTAEKYKCLELELELKDTQIQEYTIQTQQQIQTIEQETATQLEQLKASMNQLGLQVNTNNEIVDTLNRDEQLQELTLVVQELTDKYEHSVNELADVKQQHSIELQDKQAELQNISAKLQDKQLELQDKQIVLNDKQTELQNIQSELQNIQSELQDKQTELNKQIQQVEQHKEQITQLNEQLTFNEQQYEQSINDLKQEQNDYIQQLQLNLESTVANYQNKLDRQLQKYEDLQQTFTHADTEAMTMVNQLRDQNSIQINALELENTQLLNKIKEIEDDYAQRFKDSQSEHNEILRSHQESQHIAMNDLKQRYHEQFDLLKQQIVTQTEEFKVLQKESDQQTEQLANTIEDLSSQLESSKQTNQQIQILNAEFQSRLDEIHLQLESKQAVIQETTDHFQLFQDDHAQLQNVLEETTKQLADITDKYESSQNAWNSQERNLRDNVVSLQKQIESYKELKDLKNSECQQQQYYISKLEQDVNSYIQQLEDDKLVLESTHQEKEKLQHQVTELNDKFRQMESHLQQCLEQKSEEISSLNFKLVSEQKVIKQLQFDNENQQLILTRSTDIWRKETESLEQENHLLKTQLGAQSVELGDTSNDIHKLQNEISLLHDVVNQKEQQNEHLIAQLAQYELLVNQKATQHDRLQKQHHEQQLESQELQHKVTELHSELQLKQQQTEEAKQCIKKLTKQLDVETKTYTMNLKKHQDTHRKEIQELADQIQMAQQQDQLKESQLIALNQEISDLQFRVDSSTQENDQNSQALSKEVSQLKEKIKIEKLKHQKQLGTLESQLNQYRQQSDENQMQVRELQKSLQQTSNENEQMASSLKDTQDKYQLLKEQFRRLEQQSQQENQIRDQYLRMQEQLQKENGDYKQKAEKHSQMISALEHALIQNEETLKNVHEKAKDFCKLQEKEINDIKDQYLKLEAEHSLILTQNQDKEEENEQVREERVMQLMQIQSQQDEIKRYRKDIQELSERYNKINMEKQNQNRQIDELQKELAQIVGHNNPSQKIRYLNQIKQENSALKQEKQYLSEQLQKEMDEKGKIIQVKKQQQDQEIYLGKTEKPDQSKIITENQRLNSEMMKLNQILNLSGIKSRYSTMKGTEGDKIIQSVQLLIQELIDCKQEVQQRNKDQDLKNAKYQAMEKDLLLLKQKIYGVQRENPQKAQSPHAIGVTNPDLQILRDNRLNLNNGSAQRQAKQKQAFQFQ